MCTTLYCQLLDNVYHTILGIAVTRHIRAVIPLVKVVINSTNQNKALKGQQRCRHSFLRGGKMEGDTLSFEDEESTSTVPAGESPSRPPDTEVPLSEEMNRVPRGRTSPDAEERTEHRARTVILREMVSLDNTSVDNSIKKLSWGRARGQEEMKNQDPFGETGRMLINARDQGRVKRLQRIKQSHLPWMDHYRPYMRGLESEQTPGYRLFDSKSFICHELMDEESRDLHFIELFFKWRYFSSKKVVSEQPSPMSLADSWAKFAIRYNQNPDAFLGDLAIERAKYFRFLNGMKIELHELCMDANILCAVKKVQKCPMCYSSARKLPEVLRYPNSDNADKIPAEIQMKIRILDAEWEGDQKREEDAKKSTARSINEQLEHLDLQRQILTLKQKDVDTEIRFREIETRLDGHDVDVSDMRSLVNRAISDVNDIDGALRGDVHLPHGASLIGMVMMNVRDVERMHQSLEDSQHKISSLMERVFTLETLRK